MIWTMGSQDFSRAWKSQQSYHITKKYNLHTKHYRELIDTDLGMSITLTITVTMVHVFLTAFITSMPPCSPTLLLFPVLHGDSNQTHSARQWQLR
jgi:hypothetical protein